MFLNPTDSFINAHLERFIAAEQEGLQPAGLLPVQRGHRRRPLLGGRVGGLGRSVGRRLVLLMKKDHVMTQPAAQSPS